MIGTVNHDVNNITAIYSTTLNAVLSDCQEEQQEWLYSSWWLMSAKDFKYASYNLGTQAQPAPESKVIKVVLDIFLK